MASPIIIHDLAPLGDGIHHAGRERIYIDRSLPGDIIEARPLKTAAGIRRAELTRIITPSPHRTEAACPHYAHCGGCALQHANETFYRAWKLDVVRRALLRQNVEPITWLDPLFLAPGTRRRVTFAAAKKNNAVTLGYFRRRSHDVADIASCLVAEPSIMALRGALAAALAPILQDGKPVDVFIQNIDAQFDVVITGPVGRNGRPDLGVFETAAQIAHQLNLNRLSWRRHEQNQPEQLIERAPFVATFGVLSVPLPPLAFMQPTKPGEDALVSAVLEALPQRGRFADLFSGCGTFSGAMLARGSVDAFESAGTAVRALEKARGTLPLRAHHRDLFRQPLQADETGLYDAVLFDPPRAGAEAQVRALAASKVRRLIGVSCNPVSFARDARILVEGGYRLDWVRIVDQFIWSHHVELVGCFTRD